MQQPTTTPPHITVDELERAESKLRDAVFSTKTPVTPRGQGFLALKQALRTILESLTDELHTLH